MATRKSPIGEAALASATSANGTARNGATLPTNGVAGALIDCSATIVTGSVVATFKWQGSADGSTWVDIHDSTHAAFGTLSATGTTSLALPPGACEGWEYVRGVATLSGATTAAGDLTQVTYRYRAFAAASR